MKKRRGSTIFNKRHTIKEIDKDSSSSEDESLSFPIKYMKTLVMNKVKPDPRIVQINEEDEEGT